MIYPYLALIAGLSIFEINGLKKNKGTVMDYITLIGSMALAAALGWYYLSDIYRPSVMSHLLEYLNL